MKTIRDTFLARQAKEAHENRAKGEVRATSSVLRLGIIGQADQGSSGDKGGKESSDSGSSSEGGSEK